MLNATHPWVAYPLSASEVIALTNAAIASGNPTTIESLKNQLQGYNERESDLDANGNVPPPKLSVQDTSVVEGNAGTSIVLVTVALSGPALGIVSVAWATTTGSATAGSDYLAAAGTVTFAPGESAKTFAITILGDTSNEGNEAISVRLTNAAGAAIDRASASVTIVNDDAPPIVTVVTTDASGAETAANPIVLTLTRTGSTESSLSVNVAWGGTASSSDYTLTVAGGTLVGGVATFAAGSTTLTVTVVPVDDVLVESAETVGLTVGAGIGYLVGAPSSASGSIADNDLPQLAIDDLTVTEGNVNTTTVTVTVRLSAPATTAVTVTATTVAGSALAGTDFQARTATVTFAVGATTASFQVNIVNNRTAEPTETFTVVLSSPVGATIADGTALVTILDNDSALSAPLEAPSGSAAVPALAPDEISAALDSARAVWAAEGLDTSGLAAVSVVLVDLPGAILAEADGDLIRLDVDAAGWGWTASGGRIELATVLAHELGHLLGFDHDDSHLYGVMAERLAPLEPTRPVAGSLADQPRRIASSRAVEIRARAALRIAAPRRSLSLGGRLR